MLDGKPNTAGQANMIVTVVGNSSPGSVNTLEQSTMHGTAQSASPAMSTHPAITPIVSLQRNLPVHGEDVTAQCQLSSSDRNSVYKQWSAPSMEFSPQSPPGGTFPERSRVSGESVIDEDAADDDTGELLKDPVAYMQNDHSAAVMGTPPRRATNPQIKLSRFSKLSLNTNITSPPPPHFASPRANMNNHTPISAMPPSMGNIGTQHQVPIGNRHYHRHNYPPVNPAARTLLATHSLGDLPNDSSEDELKNMFLQAERL